MRFTGPAFTALMIGGLAACVHGPPYVDSAGAWLLGSVLGVCLLVSVRWLRAASLLASWALPTVWLIAAAASTVEPCKCEDAEPPVLFPEYFSELIFGLLFGTLAIYWLAAPPTAPQLPHVRALATSGHAPDTRRPDSGNQVHGT